jgi:tetratricopeptide (TPR) repeat protein
MSYFRSKISMRSAFVVALGAVVAGCAIQPSPGTVDFPISCSQPAQAEFNRAIALLHHMTYPQAREAFQRAAEIEPGCAMAHWGVAMTLFQPLWPTRPSPQGLLQGWDEVEKAKQTASTPREQLFVAAAEAFFVEPSARDYWSRIRGWETAMEQLYARFPDDPEAATFYALSHLASSTPSTARAHADRAAEILASVRTRNPDHPGAMHYLIHANDVPGREHESADVTHKYSEVAPRNPHALHMPTHIYTRLGEWDGVISGNLQAAQAALEHPAGEHGELVWDEFPHAIEYLVYAYLQKGMNDEAALQLRRLHETGNLEPTFKTAFHLSSTQARYALERKVWSEAVALRPREPATLDWNRFAWPEAITHFARGLGAAHLNDSELATAAIERLAALEASTRTAGEQLFADNIRILSLELKAWAAHARGEGQTGIELMQQAAALELSTPKHAVTPGPTLPAEELLGDMLTEQGRQAEALAAYRRALDLYPGRFNSLRGAASLQKELIK